MMNSPFPTAPPLQPVKLDYQVVSVTGRDALAFLQAQTMNDVTALADGHWHWNGWLTPKGRLIALFALLRLDAQTLWLLLPDADPHDLAAGLRRFVFRSKAVIAVPEDLHVSGEFTTPSLATHARLGIRAGHWLGRPGRPEQSDLGQPDLELDFGAADAARVLRISTRPAAQEAAVLARWREFDLAHGLPRLDQTQGEHWTPQQLSLERLQAYSVKKGCYPGQEIVARTHFLGKAKRGLRLLQTTGAIAAGDKVRQDGNDIGEVVCTAEAALPLALAVLPLQRNQTPIEINGQTATEIPIAAGLAR